MNEHIRERVMVRHANLFVDLHVDIWSANGARRTLFCFHNYLGNSGEFAFLGAFLAKRGIRVIAADMPGRGDSAHFPAGMPYSVNGILKIMRQIAEKYQEGDSYLLGTGWGGLMAQAACDAGIFKPKRMILNDINIRPDSRQAEQRSKIAELCAKVSDHRESLCSWMREELEQSGLAALDEENVLQLIGESRGVYRLKVDPGIGVLDEVNAPTVFDFTQSLLSTKTPTLMLFGKNSPRKNVKLLGRLAAAQNLTILANADDGHPASLATPEQAFMIAGFLLQPDRAG